MNESQQLILALMGAPGIGPVAGHRLLRFAGERLEPLVRSTTKELARIEGIGPKRAQALHTHLRTFERSPVAEQLDRLEARLVTCLDADYPAAFKQLSDPPLGFLLRGSWPSGPGIGIVGSRRCSSYGSKLASGIARELVEAGCVVISGLARGIDAAAHNGAIAGGGPTVGVLGCGLDVVYPPEHVELYEAVCRQGCLLSEYLPGTAPSRYTFPRRNRLVAALSDMLVVVETDSQGGAMITAEMALDLGRSLGAVPGRVDQPESRGCLELLRDGAVLVRNGADVLDEIGFGATLVNASEAKPEFEETTDPLLSLIEREGGVDLDTLCELTGEPSSALAARLSLLEIDGLLTKEADGRYCSAPLTR